jgi:hypothetical protein
LVSLARFIDHARGSVSARACKNGNQKCRFYDDCGYQRQRRQQPDVWIVPHQLLLRPLPSFIKVDALAIDEAFWGVALRGIDQPQSLPLRWLIEDRHIPRDVAGTADLMDISRCIYDGVDAGAVRLHPRQSRARCRQFR